MLFWIILAFFIISVVVYKLSYSPFTTDLLEGVSFITSLLSGIALLVAAVILIISYIGLDGYVAENHARREILIWQMENDVYDNDNDLGKRELIKDIQDWNEDLSWYKCNEKDFWIGIFIPDIYDQFEFIKLEGLK